MKSYQPALARRLLAPGCAAALVVATINGLSAQNVAPPAAPNSEAKAKEDSDTVFMEPIEVTGSHIKRLDAETVSPVIELKAADLGKIGYPSVGDALRSLPFNSGQALTPTDSGNSFTPGVSTINLRGLGNNQTLVLINGRRAVPYASPGFDGLQTVFDFNSISDSAIESVEILKDGGSAIYGSDAVAGVVNIKMRQDYQGVALGAEIGNYYNANGLLKKGSILIGNTNANLSTLIALDWSEQKGVDARDVKWAADADKTSVAHKANGRYSATGWENVNFVDPDLGQVGPFVSEQAYLAFTNPLIGLTTDAIADGQFDNRSSRGFPGFVDVNGTDRTFPSPTDNPTLAGSTEGRNLFNFQSQNGLFPAYRTYGFYTRSQYNFSSDLHAFAEFAFHRYETTPSAAATPVDIETEHGLDSADPMVLPATIPFRYAAGETPFVNPKNPFGVDITTGRRRLVELPQRINDVVSDTPRILVGLGGNLPFLEGWTWETGLLYNRNTVTNLNRGSASDSRLQQALFGLTRNADGSLAWNPATHPSQRVYFNWFGNNEPAFAKFLEINNPTSDSLQYWSYDGRASGRLFDLPAGPVSLATGFEHTAQKLNHVQTDLNAQGGVLGGSEGTSSQGQRSHTSVYAEASIPVLKRVELQLAARYEDYSDKGFKDKARPKLGLKIRPTNWLILRGSYSQSFKAPDLSYLFTASSTSFSSFQVQDPVTGREIDAVQIVTAGNPDLQPEVADTWYVGAVLEAPERGFLKGFEASVEYFDIEQKDALAQLSDFFGYAEFFQENAKGNPLFAGKVVRDPNTREVLYIKDDFTNISTVHYKAVDFGIQYTKATDSWGTFTFKADATKITSYKLDGDEIAGDYLTPQWNGTGSVSWTKSDWTVSLYEIVKGGSRRDLSFGTQYDEGDELFLTYDVKPQWISNLSVSYRGIEHTEITVGATNVLNQTPPVDPLDGVGTTSGINRAEPGFWYVRFGREF